MRLRVGRRWVFAGLFAGLASLAVVSSADACSPAAPLAPIGLPRTGATGVSTATSIVVFWRGVPPTGFMLEAGGQAIPLDPASELGGGVDGTSAPGTFWRLRPATADGLLLPSSEHVLTATAQNGPAEVTRFTTAAGYDKAAGGAPVLDAVHLWRVRYPVSDIGSGNCLFAEYVGFITVDYVPGSIPNTAAGSVVHSFQLAPKNGGSAQTFVYTGETPFAGNEPAGAYPMPTGAWQPELDPTRPYCLTISAFGDGDIARLPVTSQSICADVVQLSAAGAPPPPGGGGGGCAIGGPAEAAPPAWPVALVVALGLVVRRSRRR